MLVQLNSITALFIPDELVTGDVIQALLNATNADGYYANSEYKWKQSREKILITQQNALTISVPTEE